MVPKIATERSDGGEVRLTKIIDLIRSSKFSIHDLCRCEASEPKELARLNMPFELGVDYGAREYGSGALSEKCMLILEEEKYRYQAALSDISGCDIRAHGGDFSNAIRCVRNWLVSQANVPNDGASRIEAAYTAFQEWHYEKQLSLGFSDADIQDYPTSELLGSMLEWNSTGRPATY